MTESYELRYRLTEDLLKQAMTNWAKPHRPLRHRALRFAGILILSGCVGATLALTGVTDMVSSDFWLGILLGFYAGIALWFFRHKHHLRRLVRYSKAKMAREGEIVARLSTEGVEFISAVATSQSSWKSYDEIIRMSDATALRSGGIMYPIPHAALPGDVPGAQFHADVVRWHEAAT
ncbi:hypothetical protein ACFQFQ_04980 [Sulfitobacter porphyrae]|uniref:YcxB-like protein domain-containing protein n=1 Tax=Sulfitobacter porphyrae TaxID=1246864 RepID=A0ABW2AZY6_9RHOB|nr:hypothetical protein GCM10007928_15770 [Sulfitobacter porphyrae]